MTTEKPKPVENISTFCLSFNVIGINYSIEIVFLGRDLGGRCGPGPKWQKRDRMTCRLTRIMQLRRSGAASCRFGEKLERFLEDVDRPALSADRQAPAFMKAFKA